MDEAEVDVQAVEEIRQKAALATERERAVSSLVLISSFLSSVLRALFGSFPLASCCRALREGRGNGVLCLIQCSVSHQPFGTL